MVYEDRRHRLSPGLESYSADLPEIRPPWLIRLKSIEPSEGLVEYPHHTDRPLRSIHSLYCNRSSQSIQSVSEREEADKLQVLCCVNAQCPVLEFKGH